MLEEAKRVDTVLISYLEILLTYRFECVHLLEIFIIALIVQILEWWIKRCLLDVKIGFESYALLGLKDHLINGCTWSCSLLRKIQGGTISRKKVNLFNVSDFYKFFYRFEVVCLDGKMKHMHLIFTAQQVEIKQLQILFYHLLFGNLL